jgi:hypothetical protein
MIIMRKNTCPQIQIIWNYFYPKPEVDVVFNDDFEDDWQIELYDEFNSGYYDKPKIIVNESTESFQEKCSDDEIEVVEIIYHEE